MMWQHKCVDDILDSEWLRPFSIQFDVNLFANKLIFFSTPTPTIGLCINVNHIVDNRMRVSERACVRASVRACVRVCVLASELVDYYSNSTICI